MYRKNTASQFVCVQLLLTATGAVATGLSPTVRRCIDGTFAAGGGTVTEDGSTGSYKYAMAQADTNGNDISLIFTATGAMPVCVNFVTTAADPTDSVRLGLTSLPNAAASAIGGLPVAVDTSGRVDVLKINGTSQTARDIGASVLLSTGTGTGQLDFTSGVVKANLAQILGTALTETSGQLAAGFKKFFNIATPASTMDALTLVATATNLTNAPTAGDFTAAMKTSLNAATPAVTVSDKTGFALTSAYDPAKTASQAGDAMALTSGERNSTADAFLNRDMSTGSDSGSTTVRTVRQALRFLRNKWAISAGTLTVYKEDDSTSSWTSAVSTDGTAQPIVGTYPAGP